MEALFLFVYLAIGWWPITLLVWLVCVVLYVQVRKWFLLIRDGHPHSWYAIHLQTESLEKECIVLGVFKDIDDMSRERSRFRKTQLQGSWTRSINPHKFDKLWINELISRKLLANKIDTNRQVRAEVFGKLIASSLSPRVSRDTGHVLLRIFGRELLGSLLIGEISDVVFEEIEPDDVVLGEIEPDKLEGHSPETVT